MGKTGYEAPPAESDAAEPQAGGPAMTVDECWDALLASDHPKLLAHVAAAREAGRAEGLEEAASIADDYRREDNTLLESAAECIAKRIRNMAKLIRPGGGDRLTKLERLVAFYESVLSTMAPHHLRGEKCKIAERKGLACCNPQCNGNWGTGCWCCHHGSFAVGAAPEDIEAHLALLQPEMEMNMGTTTETTPKPASEASATTSITAAEFGKIDLRTGTILKAERIPDADKLLKIEVDFGSIGTRTIAAGIAADFEPEKIVGTQVVAVVNLPPRTIRGVESNGMILAARGGDGKLGLVTCPAPNGSRIG